MNDLSHQRAPIFHSLARNFVAVLQLLILFLGIALLAASLVPYSFLYAALQKQFGSVLTAKHFNIAIYQQKRHLLWAADAFCGMLFLALYLLRKTLAQSVAVFLYYLRRGWNRTLHRTAFAFRHVDRIQTAEIIAITAVGLLSRLAYLSQPMRFDEAHSYLDYASKPVYLLLSLYRAPVNHVFHTLLVHLSVRLFGNSPWSLRLPALIAGTLLIPLAYLFADQFYGRATAIVASALVAVSPVLIDYSTNSRGYTIVCCCTLLLFLIARLLLQKTDPILFLLLAVVASIGLFTIPTMLLPACGVLLWIVVSVRGRPATYLRPFWRSLGACLLLTAAITLFCYLPLLLVSGWRSLAANQMVKGLNSGSFVTQNEAFFRLAWQLWNWSLPKWLTVVLVIGFFLSLLLPVQRAPGQRRLLSSLVLSSLFVLLVFRFAPFARVWLFLLPIYFVLSVSGWVGLLQQSRLNIRYWLPALQISVLTLLLLFSARAVSGKLDFNDETGMCSDANDVVDFVIENRIPLDNLFRSRICNMPIGYYYTRKTGVDFGEARFTPTLQDKKDGKRDDDKKDDPTPNKSIPRAGSAWVFVNAAQGDTLSGVLDTPNQDEIEIARTISFKSGALYQFRFRH
jgi:hypothetical protein